MTKEVIIRKISEFVENIAEGRISNGVDVNKSLLNDYSFSSIDIMDLLINIRDEFFDTNEVLGADTLLAHIYTDYENGTITVSSLCEVVCKMLRVEV